MNFEVLVPGKTDETCLTVLLRFGESLGRAIGATLAGSIRFRFTSPLFRGRLLTPNDFKSLNELEQGLLAFGRRYEETASPFQWTFTRKDLTTLLAKIENKRLASAA